MALTKIANDIRLLASGPAAGLGELLLPELQAGSSIMPGKVNPVLCESVNQVAARVMGNDVTVGYAASQGILELNTYLPVMADALLESATLLGNVAAVFAERCVAGIEVDEQRTRGYAERTSALATALNPLIGYERAAAIVKQAQASGRSIIDVVVAEGVLPPDEARRVLDPLRAAGLDTGERRPACGEAQLLRKLASRSWPQPVRMLSGWNCTPSTATDGGARPSRCRRRPSP